MLEEPKAKIGKFDTSVDIFPLVSMGAELGPQWAPADINKYFKSIYVLHNWVKDWISNLMK